MDTIISYMKEIGWFDGPVYIVWLHGATDGWPQAIFLEKERAEWFVKNIYLNPEGFTIEEVDFATLAVRITNVRDYL